MNTKNIYLNPNFLSKGRGKVFVNPNFVNKNTSRNFDKDLTSEASLYSNTCQITCGNNIDRASESLHNANIDASCSFSANPYNTFSTYPEEFTPETVRHKNLSRNNLRTKSESAPLFNQQCLDKSSANYLENSSSNDMKRNNISLKSNIKLGRPSHKFETSGNQMNQQLPAVTGNHSKEGYIKSNKCITSLQKFNSNNNSTFKMKGQEVTLQDGYILKKFDNTSGSKSNSDISINNSNSMQCLHTKAFNPEEMNNLKNKMKSLSDQIDRYCNRKYFDMAKTSTSQDKFIKDSNIKPSKSCVVEGNFQKGEVSLDGMKKSLPRDTEKNLSYLRTDSAPFFISNSMLSKPGSNMLYSSTIIAGRDNARTKKLSPSNSSQRKLTIKSSRTSDATPCVYKSSRKLIRRSSKASTLKEKANLNDKPFYSVKTKTKLVKSTSSSTRRRSGSFRAKSNKVFTPKKVSPSYKNKYVRRYALNSYSTKFSPLKINQYKVNYTTKLSGVKSFKMRKKVNVKCFTNQMKNYSITPQKRESKKSDKFVNISGNLYKSTRTTLRKQSLSKSDIKLKRAKEYFAASNSKRRSNFTPKTSRYKLRKQYNLESGTLIEIVRRKRLLPVKIVNEYCFFYNKYGRCRDRAKGCPFVHDPERIAICTKFVQGSCSDKNCPYLHRFDRSRMPVCTHFLEGSCHKENCPYRHVNVNPKAPVCKNFLRGRCVQGEQCKKKHTLICEEYEKNGSCLAKNKCPLIHRRKGKKSTKIQKIKKVKNKKIESKVGVLGMDASSILEAKKQMKESSVSAAPIYRYFDSVGECKEYIICSNTLDSSLAGASSLETSCSSQSPRPKLDSKDRSTNDLQASPTSNQSELNNLRLRLLSKVQKLKHLHNIAAMGEHGCESVSQFSIKEPPKLLSSIDSTRTLDSQDGPCIDQDARETDGSIVVQPILSIPDSLPSYIPLVLDENNDISLSGEAN